MDGELEKRIYKGLIDALPQPLLVVDEAFKVVMGNPGLCRLLQKPPEEIEGQEVSALIQHNELQNCIREVQQLGQAKELQVRLRATNSGPRILKASITPLKGYLNAPFSLVLLEDVSEKADKLFDNGKLKQEVTRAFAGTKDLKELPSAGAIIGDSPQIKRVWELIEKFGPTDIPILLQGETGAGKELFARAIHELNKRSQGPFVPIDCAALPQTLLESELFGYERGAFTGADRAKPGRMELARGGTVLLDEVGNFPFSYQTKLLRCLQEREFLPLGARAIHIKPLDVRFLSATNVNLREAINKGTFREDLYYRLNGITIDVPPLRERDGDIELLVNRFLNTYGTSYGKPGLGVADEAMKLLLSYSWPGNVRELEHTIRMALINANGLILPRHLPVYLQGTGQAGAQPGCLPVPLSGKQVGPPEEGAGGKEFVLRFGFQGDVSGPVDLKKIKAAVAAQAEREVIACLRNKVHLKKGELAKFLGIDAKTLRGKLKEIGH